MNLLKINETKYTDLYRSFYKAHQELIIGDSLNKLYQW